jgi:hypothetical protein
MTLFRSILISWLFRSLSRAFSWLVRIPLL